MPDIAAKLPNMSDEDLRTLQANARRLGQSGSAEQQASAAALLPALTAEIASRDAAKFSLARERAALKAKPAAKRAAKRTPAGAEHAARSSG